MSSKGINTSQNTIEIIPAVLVKTKEELTNAISLVKPYVKTVQIDIMDDIFVPNKTIGLEELTDLPTGISYEFHWMVEEPEKWISKLDRKGDVHLVHVESLMNFEKVKEVVAKKNGRLGIACNPTTPVKKLEDYEEDVSYILVMSVQPGFSGQKYMSIVESKIKELRKKHPDYDIEVDGGVTLDTIKGAVNAGANKIVAASAIYGQPNISVAIEQLKNTANVIMHG